jgi:hypothetical protein
MIAALVDGHPLAADWLWLIAAVVFVVAALAAYLRQVTPRDWVPCLVPVGLALVAVGFLVI